MKNSVRRATTTMVLMGAASLVIGLLLLSQPGRVALFIMRICGAVLAVVGVMTLLAFLRGQDRGSQADLFIGLVEFTFGALVGIWPGVFVSWIVVLIGIFIIFTGIGDFVESRALKTLGIPSGATTLMAVLTAIFGFIVICAPFTLVDLAFGVAGVGLIFNGVTEFIAAFRNRG